MEEFVFTASSFVGLLTFGGWLWHHKSHKHNKALHNCDCCGKMSGKCTCDEHWFIG